MRGKLRALSSPSVGARSSRPLAPTSHTIVRVAGRDPHPFVRLAQGWHSRAPASLSRTVSWAARRRGSLRCCRRRHHDSRFPHPQRYRPAGTCSPQAISPFGNPSLAMALVAVPSRWLRARRMLRGRPPTPRCKKKDAVTDTWPVTAPLTSAFAYAQIDFLWTGRDRIDLRATNDRKINLERFGLPTRCF